MFAGCAVQRPKAQPAGSKPYLSTNKSEATEHKCDLLIHDLCHNDTDSAHTINVVNTDAKSYPTKTLYWCLQDAVKAKKKMYLEACLQKSLHFSPFVASVDGLLDVEAEATLKMISIRLATKFQQSYSGMCGYSKISISIILVRDPHPQEKNWGSIWRFRFL